MLRKQMVTWPSKHFEAKILCPPVWTETLINLSLLRNSCLDTLVFHSTKSLFCFLSRAAVNYMKRQMLSSLRLSLPLWWGWAALNKQVVSEDKCYLTRQHIPAPRDRKQTSHSVFPSKDRELSSRLFLTEIIS